MPKKYTCPKLLGIKVGVVPRVPSHQNFEVGKYDKL